MALHNAGIDDLENDETMARTWSTHSCQTAAILYFYNFVHSPSRFDYVKPAEIIKGMRAVQLKFSRENYHEVCDSCIFVVVHHALHWRLAKKPTRCDWRDF